MEGLQIIVVNTFGFGFFFFFFSFRLLGIFLLLVRCLRYMETLGTQGMYLPCT